MKPTQEQALDWAFECDFVESSPAEDVFSAIYVCCPKDIERLVILAYEAGRRNDNEACDPPQREWHGLTDEEIKTLWDDHIIPVFNKNGISPFVFARAIEVKLREKNT